MSRVTSIFVVTGVAVGFVLPSLLFHLLIDDRVGLDIILRNARSSEETKPNLLYQIALDDTQYINDRYLMELDKVSPMVDHDGHFLFLEIMDFQRASGASWHVNFKHRRHIRIRARDNHDMAHNVFRRLCDRKSRDRYTWTVLVDSMTYVNTHTLRHILLRLPVSIPVLIGHSVYNNTDICSLDKGVILNREAIQRVCHSLNPESEPCGGDVNSTGFNTCLMYASGVPCTDISPVFPEFYRDISKESISISDVTDMYNISSTTVFVGYNLTASVMIEMHRSVLNARTQHVIRQSRDILDRSRVDYASSQRLKRESENEIMTRHLEGIPLPHFLQNDPSLPDSFYHLIDEHGNLYKETCATSSINILNSRHDISPSYLRTLASLNSSAPDMNSDIHRFGFKLLKPNFGHEYHLYVVHDSPDNDMAQSHQVITIEEYDRPRITDKSLSQFQPVVLLVTLPNAQSTIRYVLDNIRTAVTGLRQLDQKFTCTVLVHHCSDDDASYINDVIKEYRDVKIRAVQSGTRDANNHTLTNILDDITDEHVLVRIPHNAFIREDFLLRCFLNVQRGSAAYFPIPYLRNDIERLTDVKSTIIKGYPEENDHGTWDIGHLNTYCASVLDVLGTMNGQFAITTNMHSELSRRKNFRIVRNIDKDVQILSSSLFKYQCSVKQ